VPCNRVEFVQDISVLDGTVFGPDAEFTKIWRVRNDGSCTWNGSYSLVYIDGAPAGSPASLPLFGNVRPGEMMDLAVDLRAPSQAGSYRSNWMLRSPEGVLFGLGAEADRPFWVEIRVVVSAPNSRFSFDFAANLCSAAWHTNAGTVPCLGESNSEEGSVLLLEQPELETGRIEDELTLWTRPAEQQDGYISGTYPAYKVKPGDHFLADIGCLVDNNRCDVTFSLDYTIDGYTIRNQGAWREVYDGDTTRIDVDLSGLAGHSVQFILTVINNGRPSEADAFWLAPSVRSGSPTNGLENTPAAQAARLRLAQSLGIDVSAVAFTSISAAEWSDSCLGVHIPDQVCAPVIVSGYRIGLAANARQFEAHTNSDGTIVLWFER
jgi:hypothetical protein